ncbi:MAG: DUF3093 domain-containing protein [Brachybacterium sp.]|nr:DUF3093 domain-containing protein [Brachybacterium sp.]
MNSPTSPSPLLFRERMTPSPGVWLVAALLGGMFGLILVPLSLQLAVVMIVVGAIISCVIVGLTSPVVTVSRDGLQVGRARIEPELLGRAEVLDAPAMDDALGVGFRPLEYHCVRSWIRSGVRVEITDPADPTPAWMFSSRRPSDVVDALALATRPRQTNGAHAAAAKRRDAPS